MAAVKSYTDIEQSRKLAKILSPESADTLHCIDFDGDLLFTVPKQYSGSFRYQPELTIPCWSLSALLGILPNGTDIVKAEADTENEKYMYVAEAKGDIVSTFGNNPVDACYEMIMRLNELKML